MLKPSLFFIFLPIILYCVMNCRTYQTPLVYKLFILKNKCNPCRLLIFFFFFFFCRLLLAATHTPLELMSLTTTLRLSIYQHFLLKRESLGTNMSKVPSQDTVNDFLKFFNPLFLHFFHIL